MRKLFCFLTCGVFCLGAASVQADTLVPTTIPDTNFEAFVNLTSGNLTLTMTNPEPWAVLSDALTLVGPVGALGASTPDLLTVNLPTPSQAVLLTFPPNLTSAGVVLDQSSGGLLIPVVGTGLTSVTDPALSQLLGDSNFVFSLDAANSTSTALAFDFGGAQLTSTPEPSTLITVAFGLLAIGGVRLRRRSS